MLYDPAGIERTELLRLANARKMIDAFDVSKLGPGGFRVLVGETNVRLPSGEPVASGLMFRNNFHLHPLSSADLFVPCGGRPEAVNAANVAQLFDQTGKPRFRVVVEGANLFFSEQARLQLEKKGVLLIKDASANKVCFGFVFFIFIFDNFGQGGVTSSSLEVLSALGLNDEEFHKHMCVDAEGKIPDFRAKYVDEVIRRIEENATLEFECLWREHEATGQHLTILSNKLR